MDDPCNGWESADCAFCKRTIYPPREPSDWDLLDRLGIAVIEHMDIYHPERAKEIDQAIADAERESAYLH